MKRKNSVIDDKKVPVEGRLGPKRANAFARFDPDTSQVRIDDFENPEFWAQLVIPDEWRLPSPTVPEFWNSLDEHAKETMANLVKEWNASKTREERSQSLQTLLSGMWGLDNQQVIDLANNAIDECEHCEASDYYEGAYTDGDDLVCGKCNGTAWPTPWDGY